MHRRNRLVAGILAAALMIAFPLSATADGGGFGDQVSDRRPDTNVDQSPDVVRDVRFDAVADRPGDKVVDRPSHRPTDRITDGPIDRCDVRRFAATHPDCVTDHPSHDFSIRKLIYRLIKAGEWAKLVRLLHWLGWI